MHKDAVKSIVPVPLIFLFVCAVFAVLITQNLQTLNGRDTDVLLRFSKIIELYQTHDWYNHITYRLNPPHGVFVHWTRPLDVLVLLGAVPLAWFVPLKTAIIGWSAFLVPLCFLLTLRLFYKTLHLLPLNGYGIAFALLAYVTNPYMYVIFAPLNVDTNFALHVCSVWGVYSLIRLMQIQKPQSISLGVACGLGVWISPEFLVFTAVCLMILGFLWMQNPVRYRKSLWQTPLGIAVMLALAVVLERSPIFAVMHDSVSIVHVTLFALIATAGFVLAQINVNKTMRVSSAIIFAVVLFVLMEGLFPNFYRAHYNHVTPAVAQQMLAGIGELQSLYNAENPLHAVGTLLFFVLGLLGLLWQRAKKTAHHGMMAIGTIATVYAIFALYQIRWLPYALPWFGVLGASVAMHILSRTGNFLIAFSQKRQGLDWLFMGQSCVFILLLFLGLIVQSVGATTTPENAQKKALEVCIAQLERRIVNNSFAELTTGSKEPLTLMMPLRYAGAMLFYTPHSVIAGNYHRDSTGIPDVHNFFNASTMEEAKNILDKRHVDAVIYCEGQQLDTDKTIADVPFLAAVQQGKDASWYTIVPNEQGVSSLFRLINIHRDLK
jgi:hypothetical protein